MSRKIKAFHYTKMDILLQEEIDLLIGNSGLEESGVISIVVSLSRVKMLTDNNIFKSYGN